MLTLFLFIVGAVLGSFINVVTRRYDGTRSVFHLARIEGRSHCETCKKELRWFELIPIVSFVIQRGRCRSCRSHLSWQYPIVELLSGIIVAGFPLFFSNYYAISHAMLLGSPVTWFWILMALWISAGLAFLTLAIIDLRLKLIPDELTIMIALIGVGVMMLSHIYGLFGPVDGSFFETYAPIFGARQNVFINHVFAALVGLVIFGGLFLITRGRGLGFGDVKLAGALGLLFGWPDTLLVFVFASCVGFLAGILLITFRGRRLKDAIPFGPFLALGAFLVWFCGYRFTELYFGLLI